MTPTNIAFNFAAALPEMVIAGAACLILMIDLLLDDSKRQVSYWLTQLSLLAAAYLTLLSPDEAPVRAFGNMFVTDKLADVDRSNSKFPLRVAEAVANAPA